MQPASKLTGTDVLPARLPKGTELEGYVVDGWLRDGGMAAIYRAHRASDGARVALKLQLPSTAQVPEICARFDREAEAMRRVVHEPHVVELHRAGVLDDSRRYFVMEWVEGDNLEEVLDSLRNQDQRLPLHDACEIGLAIAKGLASLHEHGLVHRDLKPANVMVARDEHDAIAVKLVDFGIVADLDAEQADAGDRGDRDHTGETIMGTSAYMAPEQLAGHPPTPAMDVFALGVVLYEALTGSCVPPDGWTPETLPAIESVRRNVPPELSALVRACMSSDAAERPASSTEVASRLGGIVERLQSREPPRASEEEIPIRTGSTKLTPRSQVAALEEAVVRTGSTEVVLTHEQVLEMSGMARALPREPSGASKMSSSHELVVASKAADFDAGTDGERRGRRWWLALLVLVPVLGGGLWAIGSGGGGGDGGGSAATVANERVVPPDAAKQGERTKGSPTPVDPAPAPALADPEPKPADPVVMPDRSASESSKDGDAPAIEPAVAPAPDGTADSAVAAEPSEPAQPVKDAAPRPKGPDKAACEKMRAEANAAKARRHWTGVLEGTKQAACWPGAAFKLERRRLRVEAYAEMANYARCVKEGGSSTDSQIAARVKWCSKKLGAGAGAGG